MSSGVAAKLADDIAGLAPAPIVAERYYSESHEWALLGIIRPFKLLSGSASTFHKRRNKSQANLKDTTALLSC